MPDLVSDHEGEETSGQLERKLAGIIVSKIRSSKAKMERMSAEVDAMKELQEGLMAKIASIPASKEAVKRILYKEAQRELKAILQVKSLLDITSAQEMASAELVEDKVSRY